MNPQPEAPLALKAHLWYQANALQINMALSGRQYKRARPPTRDEITVASCQMRLELTPTTADFASKIYRFIRAAVQKGAQLVVLPEHTGTQLLGLWSELSKPSSVLGLDAAAEKVGVTTPDVFRILAPAAETIHKEVLSQLAQNFGVYIAGGGIILPGKGEQLHSVMHLYAPNGRLVGVQRKLHLDASEASWLTPGTDLPVFTLPFGKVALLGGTDALYWESARLAWLRGADLLLTADADSFGESEPLRARGLRLRVQELPLYGVHAFMIADLFNLHWRGRSAIHAPVPLMPIDTRTLAEARNAQEEEVITATLNLAALRKFRSLSGPEFNTTLFTKYFPILYQSAEPRRR